MQENTDLVQKYNQLLAAHKAVQNDNRQLSDDLQSMKNKNALNQARVSEQNTQIDQLEMKVRSLKSDLEKQTESQNRLELKLQTANTEQLSLQKHQIELEK